MSNLMPEGEARARIVAALESAGSQELARRARAARGDAEVAVVPPAWVGRLGVLGCDEGLFIWAETSADRGDAFPSQLVAALPAGRYMVDTLDAETGEWISRESAEGGPLVAGLAGAGHAVLVWIRSATAGGCG